MPLLGLGSGDTYGHKVAAVLRHIQQPLPELAVTFVARLYDALHRSEHTAGVLGRLSEAALARLRQRQMDYLVRLLAPDLTQQAHRAEAEGLGRIHALVGVDMLWLFEAYGFYQQETLRLLAPLLPQAKQRELLTGIISRRILHDLQAQFAGYRQLDAEAVGAVSQIDHHVLTAANLPDLVRGVMTTIGALTGGVCSFFARADAAGQLQIEASFGAAAERYHAAMEAGHVPKISIDPDQAAGRGPGGRAWRARQIVVSDTWAGDPGRSPWQSINADLGLTASAAVPLRDASGRSIALLSFYSVWPGFFSTRRIAALLGHVQQVVSHAIQQRIRSPVIPLREQEGYRELLEQQSTVMLYQPIISLRDGRLIKIEALARLRNPAGDLITPDRFLPTFGDAELLLLFAQALRQACADNLMLEGQGLRPTIAVNFPAEGVGDPRYEEVLFRQLAHCRFAAGRLQLEMLESSEGHAHRGRHEAFLQRLRAAGIGVVQDDLGSGHSSLLRLEQYAFDEVKIDQGLVRSALRNPRRALDFILHLTRLAHAFATPVTVEGLENLGMIEAAAILDADRGQGYGIARPMPAAALAAWHDGYVYPIDPQGPRTALGAMAGYLLWDAQVSTIAHWPNPVRGMAGAADFLDRFIAANALQGGPLDRLLHRGPAAAGTPGSGGQQMRAQVIELLKGYWLQETRSS